MNGKTFLGVKDGAQLIAENGFVYCYPAAKFSLAGAVCVGTLDQFRRARRRLERQGWNLKPPERL